jgi:hypothetical protein
MRSICLWIVARVGKRRDIFAAGHLFAKKSIMLLKYKQIFRFFSDQQSRQSAPITAILPHSLDFLAKIAKICERRS